MLSIRPLCRTDSFTTCTTLCNDIYIYIGIIVCTYIVKLCLHAQPRYRYYIPLSIDHPLPPFSTRECILLLLLIGQSAPPPVIARSTGYIVLTHCYNDMYTRALYTATAVTHHLSCAIVRCGSGATGGDRRTHHGMIIYIRHVACCVHYTCMCIICV